MKILVIRLSSIGDIVLTTPVIRCLKTQLPSDTSVHYLTKSGFASLLNTNPYIDKIHLLQTDFKETMRHLKSENFDYIIDLHNNLRTFRIKKACRNAKSFSVNKLNFKKFLFTMFKLNRMPSVHIVDRYLQTAAYLKIKNDGKGLDYFTAETKANIEREMLLDLSEPYFSFAIGGQHFTKRMPVQKIKEVIEGANKKVVILGGKEDVEVGVELEKLFPAKLLNLVGKLNLHQSAGIVDSSLALITHDTGMMHIAAALKKPILAIWGNTVPEFGMYPYYGNQAVKSVNFEVPNLNCRPCSKIGFDHCPKGHFKCMNLQDTANISDTLNGI